MKPKTNPIFRLVGTLITLTLSPALQAADGTWVGNSGSWNDPGTWSGGIIASGSGSTAYFTTADLTADQTIILGVNRTIGHISFTDAFNSSNNLSITGNTLTLDVASGAPGIDVSQSDRSLTISSVISGSDGLQKNGLGSLNVSAASTYTGTTTVTAGTLKLTSASSNFVNPGFENTGSLGNGGFAYSPTGTGWTFTGGGISSNGQPWVDTAPGGIHAAFIQGSGSMGQEIAFSATSSDVVVSFRAANRPGFNPTGLLLQVDGVTVASLPATGFQTGGAFGSFSFPSVTVTAGPHVISFTGDNTLGGDVATAIDLVDISINGVSGALIPGALPAGTTLDLASSGAIFDMGLASQSVATLAGASGSILQNGTLTTGSSNASSTFAGSLAATGSLIKVGSGTLNLTGNNAGLVTLNAGTIHFTGTNTHSTVVNGGTLDFADGSLGTGNLTLNNGTTLDAGTRSITCGVLTLNGSTLEIGGGTIKASTNPFGTYLQAGSIVNQTAGTFDFGNSYAVLNGGSTLNLSGGTSDLGLEMLIGFGGSGGGTVTISGNHIADWFVTRFDTGVISVNLLAGGTLRTNQLHNTNTSSATLRIDGGTLAVSSKDPGRNGGELIQTGVTVLLGNAGATIDTTSGSVYTNQPLLPDGASTGGLTKTGDNTLTLNGINTYTGDTTVTGGTLAVNGSSIHDANTLILDGGMVDLSGAETVNTLFFGSVQQAAGTYTADATNFTGSGTLVVTTGPAAGFSSWASTPAFGLAPGNQGATADPENDGISNLLEYALNGNPSLPDRSILPGSVVTATAFEFTYSRLDLSLTDTVQAFQYSSNLASWTSVPIPAGPGVSTVGAATVTITDTGSTDTIKVSIPKSASDGGKLFGRLSVAK